MLRSTPNLTLLAGNRLPRLLAVLLAFACAAAAAVWMLRMVASPKPVPGDAVLVGALGPEQASAQAARLFGAEPVADAKAPAPSRYRLYGVIAGGEAGSALIGVDGKPPRAIGVGQYVAPGVVLRETAFKQVWLDRDGQRMELRLDPEKGGQLAMPSGAAGNRPVFSPPTIAPPVIAPARMPTPAPVPTGNKTDNEQ